MIVAFEVSYYACGCAECVSVVGIVVWAVDNWASIILSHFSYLKSLWYCSLVNQSSTVLVSFFSV